MSGTTPARPGLLRRWALYDFANSAFPTVIETFVFAAYFTRQVAPDPVTGSALWGTAVGLAGLVVALLGPVAGALADHGGGQRRWLLAATALCVLPTAALWWVQPQASNLIIPLLLVGIAAVGMELASVFYNALLPRLAPASQIGRWSGWGWGLGYAGGLLCLLLALFGLVREGAWLTLPREDASHVRASFVLAAAWFALFALPLLTARLPGRDAPPGRLEIRASLAELWQTLRGLRRQGALLRFLVARMLYTDALATLFAFGGVYAAGTFAMTEAQVLAFGIGLNVTAGLGAVAFAHLDDRLGSRNTIVIALLALLASGAAALLAQSVASFWAAGLALGVFVGPAQAASRSLLARMAPPQQRNQLFGLFTLSGKATAFLGPLLVGWATLYSGSQRVGMAVILGLWLAGLALLLTVPADRPRGHE
ncbi:MFS transporter [Immundisolibacter sp.]|uniref:MFS transporter n=1 Tax=Immundisolibacter sp. TaxID=1934948 RepID=UPI003F86ED62